jgi:hypothetical protein
LVVAGGVSCHDMFFYLAALLIIAPALIAFVAVLMALVALAFLSVVVWLADKFWWRID